MQPRMWAGPTQGRSTPLGPTVQAEPVRRPSVPDAGTCVGERPQPPPFSPWLRLLHHKRHGGTEGARFRAATNPGGRTATQTLCGAANDQIRSSRPPVRTGEQTCVPEGASGTTFRQAKPRRGTRRSGEGTRKTPMHRPRVAHRRSLMMWHLWPFDPRRVSPCVQCHHPRHILVPLAPLAARSPALRCCLASPLLCARQRPASQRR
jgi:hypothetical protein